MYSAKEKKTYIYFFLILITFYSKEILQQKKMFLKKVFKEIEIKNIS